MLNLEPHRKKEYWSALALRHCPGLGLRTAVRLLREFGSAYEAYTQRGRWAKVGISERIVTAMCQETWRRSAHKEWELASQLDATLILWSDDGYPPQLRDIPDAPLYLYCRGDVSLLSGPALAIVGSREASADALEVAAYMARAISASGITVISGMARGIDAAAHSSALRRIGSSIGVLGTGIDVSYPAPCSELHITMSQHGLLISEFAPGTMPRAANFPVRNRIISGLSLGVLVVEATRKSGTLITAKLALEQNRDVYAVPGRALDPRSFGCHQLIRQGAQAVFSAEDILTDLLPRLRPFGIDEKILAAAGESPSHEQGAWQNLKVKTSCLPSSSHTGRLGSHRLLPDRGAGTNNSLLDVSSESKSCAATGCEAVKHSPGEQENQEALQPEQMIWHYLFRHGPAPLDMLSEKLGLSAQVLNVRILLLEMSGKVHKLPGSRYEAVQ